MKKYTFYKILLLLFILNPAQSQEVNSKQDTLKKYSYESLKGKILSNASNFKNASAYCKAYIVKAKKENNLEELVYGYILMGNAVPDFSLALKYSDTACNLAKTKISKLLSKAYFERGSLYYNKNRLKDALNCFLIASSTSVLQRY